MGCDHVALIVEDEPEMATEIGALLRSFGHCSVRAETKEEALSLLDNGEFCYVLLDLQIRTDRQSIRPYVSAGMSLLEEIRHRFPRRLQTDMHELPVLVVSGHAKDHEDVVRAFQAGADDFIRKPLSAEGVDISLKIRHCLERADHGDGQARTAAAATDGFWHAPDYSEVRLEGRAFHFTGTIQQAVVRILHLAAQTDTPWLSGKRILAEAGSQDSAMKLRNLFGNHPAWSSLIESDTRGKYRLRIERR